METLQKLKGWRKLALGVVLIICASALTWQGSMTIDQWIDFTQTVAGFTLGAQAVSDFAKYLPVGGGK